MYNNTNAYTFVIFTMIIYINFRTTHHDTNSSTVRNIKFLVKLTITLVNFVSMCVLLTV